MRISGFVEFITWQDYNGKLVISRGSLDITEVAFQPIEGVLEVAFPFEDNNSRGQTRTRGFRFDKPICQRNIVVN